MEINEKEYIGDGIYAKFDGQRVTIWTSNGKNNSDVIYFDEYTAEDLMKFFQQCFS